MTDFWKHILDTHILVVQYFEIPLRYPYFLPIGEEMYKHVHTFFCFLGERVGGWIGKGTHFICFAKDLIQSWHEKRLTVQACANLLFLGIHRKEDFDQDPTQNLEMASHPSPWSVADDPFARGRYEKKLSLSLLACGISGISGCLGCLDDSCNGYVWVSCWVRDRFTMVIYNLFTRRFHNLLI